MNKLGMISRKKLFSIVYILICVFIFMLQYGFLNEINNVCIIFSFFLNISLLFILILNDGFDLVFLFLFCLNYLLVPIMMQYFTGSSYGLLGLDKVPLYMPEILTNIFIYNVMFVLLTLIFNFAHKEYSLIQTEDHSLNNFSIWCNNFVAIIFTIVAFPRLGFTSATRGRFDMLLPGTAWNQLAIVALLFNLPYLRKRVDVKIVYLFVILWFLIDGERADITGLVLGIVVYYLMNNIDLVKKGNFKRIFLSVIFIFCFAIILNLIIALRQNSSFNFSSLIKGILITPTTADVGYLYNVSIDYLKKFGTLGGRIFIANIKSIIPFANPVGFDQIIISANYSNPGGEPLLAEPIMDFGRNGLYFISSLDFLILNFVVNHKNYFFKKEFIVILCLVPRIVWYGRSYAFSSVLFFVPLLSILDYIANKLTLVKLKGNY